jgi:hypothetical protein
MNAALGNPFAGMVDILGNEIPSDPEPEHQAPEPVDKRQAEMLELLRDTDPDHFEEMR